MVGWEIPSLTSTDYNHWRINPEISASTMISYAEKRVVFGEAGFGDVCLDHVGVGDSDVTVVALCVGLE